MHIWIALAIIGVIVLRRFSPIAGSVLGMAVAVAVAVWGYLIYAGGGAVGIVGKELPAMVFYLVVALWLGVEIYSLLQAARRRRRHSDSAQDA